MTNIGVLLGVFILIFEIRQNTISIQNQTDVAIAEIGSSQASLFVMEPELAALSTRSATERWTDFSPVEQTRLGISWGLLVDRVCLQRNLFERIGEQLTRDNIVFPEVLIKRESFRTWWEEAKQDGTYSESEQEFFDAYIDSVLADS